MKFVSFLDSFFILSLGITFSLLLGLIYHFRNRLNENENKYEQLLSIVNDIVKKLNEQSAESSIKQNIYYNNEYEMDDEIDNITNTMEDTLGIQNFNEEYQDDYEEEEEEEEEEEDEEEDDDDDDDDDEEDDDDDEDEEEDDDEEEIMESLEILDENVSDDEGDVKLVNLSDVIEIDNEIEEEEQEDPIIDEPEVVNIQPLNENVPSVKVEKSLDINYHALNVGELKKIIKDKDINVSISKMKKQDLIELLESNE